MLQMISSTSQRREEISGGIHTREWIGLHFYLKKYSSLKVPNDRHNERDSSFADMVNFLQLAERRHLREEQLWTSTVAWGQEWRQVHLQLLPLAAPAFLSPASVSQTPHSLHSSDPHPSPWVPSSASPAPRSHSAVHASSSPCWRTPSAAPAAHPTAPKTATRTPDVRHGDIERASHLHSDIMPQHTIFSI